SCPRRSSGCSSTPPAASPASPWTGRGGASSTRRRRCGRPSRPADARPWSARAPARGRPDPVRHPSEERTMKRAWPLLLMLATATTVRAQATTDVVPNENLVVDGVPKIPASVAEGVGRYTEFRTAGLGAWHPLRREILITTRFADTNQVHRVRAPGADRTQLTFFPDRVAGVSYEPVRGDFFLFSKDKGGDEFGQLFRYDLATGASTLITDGGRSQNGGVRWSTKGDRIAYASTRRNGRDRDVYVMDPREAKTDRLVLQGDGGGWSARDWSPDDTKLLVAEGLSANESRLWVVDVAGGAKTLLTPKEGEP